VPASFSPDAARAAIDAAWAGPVLDTLHDFVRIPNLSPAFDPGWEAAGHMDRAVELVRQWCDGQLPDATVEVRRIEGRTPLLLVDVPAHGPDAPGADRSGRSPEGGLGGGAPEGDDDTVVLYGHLDKQPPFEGWRDGLGPWTPVVEDGRLYGRGAADDGYAAFAALTTLAALRLAGGSHARCLVLIEASEESGSPDLPAHLDGLGDALGDPTLVVGLDSGCQDWEHLWVTSSLRGMIIATVQVEVLAEGIHSGTAGGAVASSFRILRQLLDRIEDSATGQMLLPEMHVEVPVARLQQIAATAAELTGFTDRYPLTEGVAATYPTTDALLRATSWEPSLEVTGLDGAPPPAVAGNVLRPSTTAKLSIRLPPTADAEAATRSLRRRLTEDPPYGARLTVEVEDTADGWHAPEEEAWLRTALDEASQSAFGRPARVYGEGGSIPFMTMLGRRFPRAQFVITGVLGPGANAHGPNEFLDLATARRVTLSVAHVLHAHATRSRS
jgi:acetylornithine deacetylase/succinyl-diaminopimelate desuccinylase-like protein